MYKLLYFKNSKPESLFYYIVVDKKEGYGIQIVSKEEDGVVRREESRKIFRNEDNATRFLSTLFSGSVLPIHLNDIVRDELLDGFKDTDMGK